MINVPKFLVCNPTGLKPRAVSNNIKWLVGKQHLNCGEMWGFSDGDCEESRALDVTPYCWVGMYRRSVGSCCILPMEAAGRPCHVDTHGITFSKTTFAKADVYFRWWTRWINMMTRLLTARSRNLSSIPISGKWLLSSTLLQHRLWGPPNILLSVYGEIFFWGKATQEWSQPVSSI